MVLLRLSVVVYLRDSVPMSPAKEITYAGQFI